MFAKPCSSNVRDSDPTTSRSTTRAAGRNSGKPLSGVGLFKTGTSKSSGDWTGGRRLVVLELEQERVGRALAADGRLAAVTRQDHDVVGEGQHLGGEAPQHRRVVAAREVGAADRALE